MDTNRWDRIQTLFHGAADLPVAEQQSYLQAASQGDEALISAVRAMLDEDARATSLLNSLPGLAHVLLSRSIASFGSDEFGPYRIVRLLGEGGMGIVYLAEHRALGAPVAIKLLRDASLSPMRRERFALEQTTLAQLRFPSIARIYDSGALSDGTPWFVMEYVDGVRITEYSRDRELSIRERLLLFRRVCEAVQYAHSQTVIHRDLKPSNIFVTPDGTVKLLDFGIAKRLDAAEVVNQTRTVWRPMTLAYASPEQIRAQPLGIQTDVYSLGVILYELLAGRLPFEVSGKSQAEAETVVLEGEPVVPSKAAGRTGKGDWRELDVLVLKAMHKDRSRRYASAEALIRDIDHYLKAEPLEARPDTLEYRLSKFAARNWLAISATAVTILLIAVLVTFFAVRLANAHSAALAEAAKARRIEGFTLSLFDGGDNAAAPAAGLQAVTLLDRGVQSVRALKSDPAVQADLYQTLGVLYQRMGKLDRADPLLRSALEKRQAAGGSEAAGSLVALGLLRMDQGQAKEAERLIRKGLALSGHGGPERNFDRAVALSGLGRVLEEGGAYDEAVKDLQESVRLLSPPREASPEFAESLTNLATAQRYLGQLQAAEAIQRDAISIDRQLYGEVHPRTAEHLYDLGGIEHDLGRNREAERDYREALSVQRAWYGTEHPDTALMIAAVGQALIYQGRLEEASPYLEEALAIQERVLGKMHPQVAMSLDVLGVLDMKRGRFPDAEAAFLRMNEINRATYGDRHLLVAVAYMNLGEVYFGEKDPIRAERALREALARFPASLPSGHVDIGLTEARLGHALLLELRYKDAEAPLLAGYGILTKQQSLPAARIESARKDIVVMYQALNRPEEARKFSAAAK